MRRDMQIISFLKLATCMVLSICCLAGHAQQIQVLNLKTDLLQHTDLLVAHGYLVSGHKSNEDQRPWVISKKPVFGWELSGTHRNTVQSAYHLLVSESADSLLHGVGEIWDSGKVESSESIHVEHQGKPLHPSRKYSWKVKVWDQEGRESAWSAVSTFWTAEDLQDDGTSVYPLLKSDETPQRILHQEGVYRMDFGKASFGQLRLSMESETGGDTVTVRLGEAVDANGSINRDPGGTIRYAAYQVPLKRGRHTYQLQFRPDARNTGPQAIKMPDYIGEVLPFRYCELENYGGKLEGSQVIRSTVHYPFDDFSSHFESSDSILNAVWELCKYSIKATSFAGIYVDGDRERIPYEADAYINQLCHYGVDKEYTMARRSHEYLLHNATWPTEWILQSVLMAYNDYLYTGDVRSARHHYEDLKAKLLLPLREPNGLLSTRLGKQQKTLMQTIHFHGDSLRDIVDWPHTGGFGMVGNGETDGFVFTAFNAVVNAFHYKALTDMTKLAEALGYEQDAVLFEQKATETKRAFQSLFWDRKRKVFRDGVDTDHASLHTNMMAMAFGLVPDKNVQQVMDFIRSRGMACSVYGSQFLMDAIYHAGDGEYGLALLSSQSDRSWYNMIRAGSTITMEAWDNKYKPNQDWNHAWGAVPANIIPRKLMGVEPLQPGWGVFRIRPQIGSLEWASIKVPSIRGTIGLSCERRDGIFSMHISIPPNSVANVEVPCQSSKRTTVSVNGQTVTFTARNGFVLLPDMGSGEYHIVVDE